jgi:RsiW-degrading membrane proteinase PrsW (M82 family)
MSSKTTPPDSKDTTRVVIAAVAVLAVVWFAFANRQRVNISWWLFDRQSRLIYVIIVSAALGAIADRFLLSRKKKN